MKPTALQSSAYASGALRSALVLLLFPAVGCYLSGTGHDAAASSGKANGAVGMLDPCLRAVLARCDSQAGAASASVGAGGVNGGAADASTQAIAPRICRRPPWRDAADDPELHFPHNVILMIGDGMGTAQLDAARALAGAPLAIDSLNGPVLYRSDSLDFPNVTDSAAAGTALATGHCAYNGTLALSPDSMPRHTVLEFAQHAGKATGLVTNSYLIDATPMAFAVHVNNRFSYDEVACQLLGSARPDVLLGGFVPASAFILGPSLDLRAEMAGFTVGLDLAALQDAPQAGEPLIGLFGRTRASAWPDWGNGITPEALRPANSDEPKLAEMARFALDRLAANDQGFFVMIESEYADTLGHQLVGIDASLALLPGAVLEFDRAVAEVIRWVEAESNFEETLLVIGADHETGAYSVLDGGTFSTAGHTNTPVALYARGPGDDQIKDVQHLTGFFYLLTGALDHLPAAAPGRPAD